ncbi:MAG: maleylpyruvate isomerase N-terminal domain-containing protein [Kineosporiaceae bacterium]|nr:maleylpyruvate isomerase N-terminal domain-containing protein [Kineosporiaceae bacterium]
MEQPDRATDQDLDHRSGTSPIRTTYLRAAEHVVQVISRPEIGERWQHPSALEQMSIGDLTAHLCRSIQLVAAFLDNEEPPADDVITPQAYFADIAGLDDRDSAVSHGVRERSRQDGGAGHAATLDSARRTLGLLATRLQHEPAGRRVSAFGGRAILLDDFLRTRLVEFAVHLDDLTVSLGDDAAAEPEASALTDALSEVIDLLVGVARRRHGDLAVLRALTRRERDLGGALHVF